MAVLIIMLYLSIVYLFYIQVFCTCVYILRNALRIFTQCTAKSLVDTLFAFS